MGIDRRTLLSGPSAALIAPPAARAASVTDAAGRAITIPDKVERIFAAGPPAAILLYTLAPDLLFSEIISCTERTVLLSNKSGANV